MPLAATTASSPPVVGRPRPAARFSACTRSAEEPSPRRIPLVTRGDLCRGRSWPRRLCDQRWRRWRLRRIWRWHHRCCWGHRQQRHRDRRARGWRRSQPCDVASRHSGGDLCRGRSWLGRLRQQHRRRRCLRPKPERHRCARGWRRASPAEILGAHPGQAAIFAEGGPGTGVFATADAAAVNAVSNTGIGVSAFSASGNGVSADSTTGLACSTSFSGIGVKAAARRRGSGQ